MVSELSWRLALCQQRKSARNDERVSERVLLGCDLIVESQKVGESCGLQTLGEARPVLTSERSQRRSQNVGLLAVHTLSDELRQLLRLIELLILLDPQLRGQTVHNQRWQGGPVVKVLLLVLA